MFHICNITSIGSGCDSGSSSGSDSGNGSGLILVQLGTLLKLQKKLRTKLWMNNKKNNLNVKLQTNFIWYYKKYSKALEGLYCLFGTEF